MIYLLGLAGFLVFFLLMALGVILSKKPLRGSCGGLAALKGFGSRCEICGAKPEDQANCQKQFHQSRDVSHANSLKAK